MYFNLILRHTIKRYKTTLKRYAAKTSSKIKDRMMLIIKIKYGSTDIHEVVKSFRD